MSIGNQATGGNAVGQTGTTDGGSVDEVRRKTAELKQNAQDLTSAAKAAANEKLGEIRSSANEYYETSRQRVYEAEASVEDYIRDQPVKAMLIAAGVGFFLGACYVRR